MISTDPLSVSFKRLRSQFFCEDIHPKPIPINTLISSGRLRQPAPGLWDPPFVFTCYPAGSLFRLEPDSPALKWIGKWFPYCGSCFHAVTSWSSASSDYRADRLIPDAVRPDLVSAATSARSRLWDTGSVCWTGTPC